MSRIAQKNGFLCGYFHSEGADRARDDIREGMLRVFSSREPVSRIDTQKLVLGTAGDVADHKNRFHAAIIGTPYWKTAELDEYSKRYGPAATCAKAYEEHSLEFVKLLGGRFLFALQDKRENRFIVGFDRIGLQQCYYAISGRMLVFATRADAVVSHPQIGSRISSQGLYEYMYFHALPSPGSIYEGVNKLVNGEYLVFQDGEIKRQSYWQPTFAEEATSDNATLYDELHDVIGRSVTRAAQGDSVGAFLSGGLDSSTVAGMLSKAKQGRVPTFSIGFDTKGYDEIEYARVASSTFSTEQHEYYVTPEDVVNNLENIIGYFDEPFGNSSALPAYFCAKMAKESGITRMLAGDGGDELFAGNERYVKQDVFELYARVPDLVRKVMIEPLMFRNPFAEKIPVLKKIHSYIRQAKIPLPDRMESYNFLHQHDIKEIFSPGFVAEVDPERPLMNLRDSYWELDEASTLNRMLWLDWKRTLHDNDLVKVNRMCELAGVDVEYPLLDDEVVDFSCKIPSKLKIRNGKLRWFYKQGMRSFLPEAILHKRKHGFGLPFGIWTSQHKELQDIAYTALESLKARKIFNESFIDKTMQMHRSVHAKYYGELIWILMTLELWLASR